jgi:hypothetical protein
METQLSLLERIKQIQEASNRIVDENPNMKSTWWEIYDADLEEMRGLPQSFSKIYFSEGHKRMALQAHYALPGRCTATIFVMSKIIKVKEHIVVTDAIVNI